MDTAAQLRASCTLITLITDRKHIETPTNSTSSDCEYSGDEDKRKIWRALAVSPGAPLPILFYLAFRRSQARLYHCELTAPSPFSLASRL